MSGRKKMADSLGLDEFGVIHDEPSSHSLEDSNPNLTDDDFSARMLTSGSHPPDLTADTTGASDDPSPHSDHASHHTEPAHNETESLTEFEEIERLIKEHTIQESDEEIPELPVDLEERILSGRVSRASDLREASSSSSGSSGSESEECVEPEVMGSGAHQDTGYVSEGHGSTALAHDVSSADDVTTPPERQRDERSVAPPETSHFPIPTNRQAVGDTQQPDSLVATFGTTEDFEALLKQQLDDMDAEEMEGSDDVAAGGDAPAAFVTSTSSGELRRARFSPTQVTSRPTSKPSRLRLSADGSRSTTADRKPRPVRVSQKKSVAKSREDKSPAAKTGRFPAASRAKRVASGARLSYRDSSDDLSVRSDVSRTELRSKLKEEARNRKQDEEFMNELKNNYDALLMKYAEAENTIDHLRLGAKINLFATLPHPQANSQHHPASMHQGPDHVPQVPPPSYEHVRSPSGGSDTAMELPSAASDTLVESSLQLPAAATKEFLKVALQLQAKDLKDKLDSFGALLRESALSGGERDQVMRGIEEALRDLEGEYLRAIDQHADEQRRASIATGGAISASQEFDPDRSMEEEIMTLGQVVRDLRQRINDVMSASEDERSLVSSPDVESRFNDLLHQYQPPPQPSDLTQRPAQSSTWTQASPRASDSRERPTWQESRHPGRPTSGPEESSDTESSVSSVSELGRRAAPSRPISNRYLEPSPHSDDITEPKSSGSATTAKTKSEGFPSRSRSGRRPRGSRLPRPVAQPGKKEGPRGEKKLPPNAGTDSGFVGSESSRQSATARLQPAKVKLVSVPPSAPLEVKKVPEQRGERRAPPHSVASTSTQSDVSDHPLAPPSSNSSFRSPTNFRPPTNFSGLEGLGAFRPPHAYSVDDETTTDDVSTTSTVREMLHPRSPPVVTKQSGRSQKSASVRSTGSGARSMASTSRDSALNLIRGEINKLREEIEAAKTPLTSTPRRHPVVRRHSVDGSPDGAALRVLRDDIKALKDELRRDKLPKRTSDSCSAASVAPSNHRRPRSESRGGERAARSRSLDRSVDRGRRRSRSYERRPEWGKGFWTYVPPTGPHVMPHSYEPPTPIIASTPRAVPAVMHPPSHTVMHPPSPTVVHAPVIYPSMAYVAPQAVSRPGRVYLKEGYVAPSKPKASLYTSATKVRKANVYVVTSDDDGDVTLHRSSSFPRRSVVLATSGSKLDESLKRAERSSDQLRCHSRAIYRSTRDSLYGSRLLADTL